MNERRPLVVCQRRLLAAWGSLGGIALVIVLFQVAPGGVYAAHRGEVLNWFLPTVVPTLSLMIGAVVALGMRPDPGATVDGLTYRLALWLSVAYLGVVIAALLMFPQSRTPVNDLKGSATVITAIYSLVGIALGALFGTKRSGV